MPKSLTDTCRQILLTAHFCKSEATDLPLHTSSSFVHLLYTSMQPGLGSHTWSVNGKRNSFSISTLNSRLVKFGNAAKPRGISSMLLRSIQSSSSFCRQLMQPGMDWSEPFTRSVKTLRFTSLLMSGVSSCRPPCASQQDVDTSTCLCTAARC
jgi:hypothetical protein